jgi:long-subunit fatty acid transport protein
MRIYILFFCFLSSFVCSIFAEGTTASFLKLGFSARARGLGESFSAVSETPDAIFYNPAGITNIQRNEINFSYGQLLENVNYNSLRYIHSLYNNNAIGIMINYLS